MHKPFMKLKNVYVMNGKLYSKTDGEILWENKKEDHIKKIHNLKFHIAKNKKKVDDLRVLGTRTETQEYFLEANKIDKNIKKLRKELREEIELFKSYKL